MEKQIKTLYTITIIAIIAFLAMQSWWLYGRYEYSLGDYERDLSRRVAECVADYNAIREKASDIRPDSLKNKGNDNILSFPTMSLRHEYGDTVKTTRTAKIYTYLFSAHELLGLESGTPLSDEQKSRAIELAQLQMKEPADSVVFDASGAKDEKEAWVATNNVHTERQCRFTAEGIDSVLSKAGIRTHINIDRADSAVWNAVVENHKSVLAPELTVTIPYSQLEGRTVTIVCPINPFDILPGMWRSLVISIVVSTLLIVCLVLQFSTILRLNRLDRMRNGFITTMIHELKRPISTLKMCVSGIENETMMSSPEIKRELVAATRGALDNLSAYFSKLRDITFNNVEQIPLNITDVNLHGLFDDVCSDIAVPPAMTIAFVNDIDAAVSVAADRSHLSNILSNLLENAVKYAGDGIEVRASSESGEHYVAVTVADNGCGIPSSDMPHIFKRFYRGKASASDRPGMGLGLTYVRLLVEAHGGAVRVESREGIGTSFTITLPR